MLVPLGPFGDMLHRFSPNYGAPFPFQNIPEFYTEFKKIKHLFSFINQLVCFVYIPHPLVQGTMPGWLQHTKSTTMLKL